MAHHHNSDLDEAGSAIDHDAIEIHLEDETDKLDAVKEEGFSPDR